MNSKQIAIGILGGMGPYATAAFYKKILDMTPAKKDWDHLRIVIDSNPHIPSRSRYFLYGEASPVPDMIVSCRKLESYPVDYIAIPCNSACCFLNDVQKLIGIEILNIIEIAVESLDKNRSAVKDVAVLGGALTYGFRAYESFLKSGGFNYIHHSHSIQGLVEELIEKVKINRPATEVITDFQFIVKTLLQEQSVDAIILGCTEFGCLLQFESEVLLIDSSLELAKRIVEIAKL